MTGVNNVIYSFFRNSFINRFTHIHCPSRFIAGELENHGYTAQLHVISNGVDRCFRYRKQAKPACWEDQFVILMIGRLSNEKRQDVLIDAVKKSRHADRIRLVLAGPGPQPQKIRDPGGRPGPSHRDRLLREAPGCWSCWGNATYTSTPLMLKSRLSPV